MGMRLNGSLLIVVLMGILFIFPIPIGIPSVNAEEVHIICNKDVPYDELSRDEVKKIFLGLKTEWNSQLGAKFALLIKNSPLHKQFLKKYVDKSTYQFSMYWKQRVFKGAGIVPRSYKSETELIEYVAKTKGAIGYASQASNPKVKTISVQ